MDPEITFSGARDFKLENNGQPYSHQGLLIKHHGHHFEILNGPLKNHMFTTAVEAWRKHKTLTNNT